MTFTKIQICIYNQIEFNKYKTYFKNHPVLEIVYGNIFNYKADCMITAGQSFGMMDGGIDGDTNYFFGMIEKRVQDNILQHWRGELPVGVSLVLDTPDNSNFKYLCYTPTMRIPCNVAKTNNAYYAFRGALIECSKYDIKTIVTPLLAHGIGCIDTKTILDHFKHAYDTFMNPTLRNWHAIGKDNAILMN